MTIQQLKYVVALDNHRNFVKASESCFVAQPTLTLQVKKLEQQIAITLFDRSSQPLKPTPMGEIFIKKARDILVEIDQLKALINNERNLIDGSYKIGIIPTLAPYLLPLFIKEFLNAYPKVQLQIKELQSEALIEALETEKIDIAILATPLNEKNIVETPLFYEPFLVYTDDAKKLSDSNNRISTKDLKPEGLFLLENGHCFRNHTLKICDFNTSNLNKNLILEGGSIETLKLMINKVSGYTLIPELSYQALLDKNHTLRFTDPQPVREISIATHKNFTREKLILEMRKFIVKHTPDSFEKNKRFVKMNWR